MIPHYTAVIPIEEYNKLREVSQKYQQLIHSRNWLVLSKGYGYSDHVVISGKDKVVNTLSENLKNATNEVGRLKEVNEKTSQQRDELRMEVEKLKEEISILSRNQSEPYSTAPIQPQKKKFLGIW